MSTLDQMVNLAKLSMELENTGRDAIQVNLRIAKKQIAFIDAYAKLTNTSRAKVTRNLIDASIERLWEELPDEIKEAITAMAQKADK